MANEINITMTAKDLASGKIKGVGKSAQSTTEKLRGMRGSFLAVGAAGAALVGSLALVVSSFAKTGDLIQKMSLRTGFTTESLSELKFALEQSGSSIEGFEKSIRRVTSFIQDGRDGLTETTDALDLLGLSVNDFKNVGVEEAFFILANALAGIDDTITQAALAQDVFGRSGTALLPMLSQGADGIAKLRKEARELGIVFDQETANKAARLVDAQNTLTKSVDGLKFAMAVGLAPIISGIAESLGVVTSKISDFADKNPALTKTIVILTGVLGTLAIGITALGLAIPIMTIAYGGLAKAVIAAAGAKALLTTALWGNVAAWIALHAATGGIFLAIALGVTALIAGLVLLVKNWDKVVHAVKVGANFIIGILENLLNFWLDVYINPLIKGLNLLGKVLGFHVDEIEVEFGRIDTTVIDTAAVVKENTANIEMDLRSVAFATDDLAAGAGDAFQDMRNDYSDLTEGIVESSAVQIKAFDDVAQAHSDSVTRFIKFSRLATAEAERRANLAVINLQNQISEENDLLRKASDQKGDIAEQDLRDSEMFAAEHDRIRQDEINSNREKAEAIVADSDAHYADLKEQRWANVEDDVAALQTSVDERREIEEQALADELELFQLRQDAADALAERNAEAFAAIRMQVSMLPANIAAAGGIVPGGAGVALMFKASQQNVLNQLDSATARMSDLEFQLSKLTDPASDVNLRNTLLQRLAQARGEVGRLEGITGTAGFRGERLGALLHTPGGGPPMLPGMGDDLVTKQVFAQPNVIITGDVYGMDEFNARVNRAFMAGEQLGTTGAI